MTDLTIRTNHVPRDVVRWRELTDKERVEFDYIDTPDRQNEAEFARYKGVVYDLRDMERGVGVSSMPSQFISWDDYLSDSFFSGILIRWVDQGERVVMATYFC